MKGPRPRSSVVRELTRVKRTLAGLRADGSPQTYGEQYGAMQALEWVLRNNAAAPHTLAPKKS
jgi:hypothetical protein